MKRERLKAYIYALLRQTAKYAAISLVLFGIIFFIWFMKNADETGINAYYNVIHAITSYPRMLANYRTYVRWIRPKPVRGGYSQVKEDSIQICWNTHDDKWITAIRISRSVNRGKFKKIARVAPSEGCFTDKKISLGAEYAYSMRACRLFICSPPARMNFKSYDLPPAPPSDLKAVFKPPNQVELTWSYQFPPPKSFLVEIQRGGTFVKLGKTEPDQTKFSHCPAAPGEIQTYRVSSFGGYFYSEERPTVSIAIPDTERIGESRRRGEVGTDYVIRQVVWNGEGWATVFSGPVEDEGRVPRYEEETNREVYFQRLDKEFHPVGSKTRLSFDPCYSDNPSLAWNGREYGVVWSDSRGAKDQCYEGGDYYPARELYFTRVSAQGERIGPEVRLLEEHKNFYAQKIFWIRDRYAVFFNSHSDINYLSLDRDGKIIDGPREAGESNWMWDVTQAGERFGVSWISTNWVDENILYLLDFDPAVKEIHPIKIAMTVGGSESEGCLTESYQIAPPSVFWTGSVYGVCYKNCNGNAVLALAIPSSREHHTFVAARLKSYECPSEGDFSREMKEFAALLPVKCSWNGSEIALIASVSLGGGAETAFMRFATDGQQIGHAQYLKQKYAFNEFPFSDIYWHDGHYFLFASDTIITIKP